jgi:hypothetical protein
MKNVHTPAGQAQIPDHRRVALKAHTDRFSGFVFDSAETLLLDFAQVTQQRERQPRFYNTLRAAIEPGFKHHCRQSGYSDRDDRRARERYPG